MEKKPINRSHTETLAPVFNIQAVILLATLLLPLGNVPFISASHHVSFYLMTLIIIHDEGHQLRAFSCCNFIRPLTLSFLLWTGKIINKKQECGSATSLKHKNTVHTSLLILPQNNIEEAVFRHRHFTSSLKPPNIIFDVLVFLYYLTIHYFQFLSSTALIRKLLQN